MFPLQDGRTLSRAQLTCTVVLHVYRRMDAKPQKMISEGLKILAFLQLKLRWPANPGQGPEGAVARRRVACRALSGAGLAARYLHS